ncbi:FIG00908368: hypothetical protein [Olavius algarvensis associated proteobacterium Delta 3]|nr:FIG00908368: hypothetical protein [Olavius algarvensis associated proteobacterium Delta 3]CAB5164284.1 FIG00908368: hypothetical protein [Olavius algarvensis associated proteobacterium Delta 3]
MIFRKGTRPFIVIVVVTALSAMAIDGWHHPAHATPGPVIAHTSGFVSKAVDVRVVFRMEAGAGTAFPRRLEKSPFTFTPGIAGEAVWVNSRTLEFRPYRDLVPGKTYDAVLDLTEVMEVTGPPETFTFNFSVMKQSIEIAMDGLTASDPKDPRKQRFSGTLVTADIADADRVEKTINVMMGARPLGIEWQHSPDQKTHRFEIDGLMRTNRDSALVLAWDGSPIGALQKGRHKVMLRAADTFDVLFARPVQTAESMIEIRMTDPLDSRQNLVGLVTVDGKDVRTDISGNRLSVYLPTLQWGDVSVSLSGNIRNSSGRRLGKTRTVQVAFTEVKPQVRFAGKATVVPTSHGLTVPVETANLRRLTVSAIRIPTDNLPQFLQVNNLDEDNEIKRVGRTVWKRTIDLNWQPEMKNRWVRHGLDLTELAARFPGGMFRLSLSFTYQDVDFGCLGSEDRSALFATVPATDEGAETETSYWDSYAETGGYENWENFYRNRENPCHPAYYMSIGGHDIIAARNAMISDIGLLAKRGDGTETLVVATDIRNAMPLAGVAVDVLNYQQEILASGITGDRGMVALKADTVPFLAVARYAGQWGFLKLDNGSANSLSHFDVAGAEVKKGLKGFLYGERGVWRPGDTLHLTFILDDAEQHLPANHPVRFELLNPKGQLVRTLTRTTSLNGFYDFTTVTSQDAPTGNWLGRVTVGGVRFEKRLKIETVIPNRLKIRLDFGDDPPVLRDGPISGRLHSQWLHGAPANSLKAKMELELRTGRTVFPAYETYIFDDPVRRYRKERFDVFDGTLDEKGDASFSTMLSAKNDSPGMLTAVFNTRVFEPSGAFSTDIFNVPFHPYSRYVGVRLPKGDAARGMLLTDTDHTVHIALLDSTGKPVPEGRVRVAVYKLKWRWWWEKGKEDLADYVGTTSFKAIQRDTVDIRNGSGEWTFRINYPQWGRYLVRVSDEKGDHVTGKIAYVDWPGWAGRGQKEIPGGATVLSFSSDKTEYRAGENIMLTIPAGRKGRGLVSIEKGGRVLRTDWIDGGTEPIRFELTATAEMAPNVFAHVTYLQPHLETDNDLPIRMYGVIPIRVVDPETRLSPVIRTPETFEPESSATVTISEASGRPMTYTLAIVDEGLLDLTRFATPDPWAQFYLREALGVKTWDLFDDVAGAYGGLLEQLLAVGGGDEAEPAGEKKAKRFPPMVRFAGPFFADAGTERSHVVDIPQYVGSVRVMVVAAASERAFGWAEKAVPVKKPLMVLGTLPRVVSPEEEIVLPVTVFALDPKIRQATVSVAVEGSLLLSGEVSQEVSFPAVGDQMTAFRLRAAPLPGHAVVRITAVSGSARAEHRIDIEIRSVTFPVTTLLKGEIPPGGTWQQEVVLPGITGTNSLKMEVSSLPTMQLGQRLSYLIRYPHGCLEQTISAVFPQLYLTHLLTQTPQQRDRVAENVQTAIEKLNRFLSSDGGFVYWPGGNHANTWADIYTGHFLFEARKAGYLVPTYLTSSWLGSNRRAARSWVTGPEQSMLEQTYRLYVLALAGAPEMGAMNRLREDTGLSTAAKWRLAAAYAIAGQPEAADALTGGLTTDVAPYTELSGTFGSALRDQAMILETLFLMDRMAEADALARQIREKLGSHIWYGTQSVAQALIAVARYAGLSGPPPLLEFTSTWNGGKGKRVKGRQVVMEQIVDPSQLDAGGIMAIRNHGRHTLYAQIVATGHPAPGQETAAREGLDMRVRYVDINGDRLNIHRLPQGTDLIVEVEIKNDGRTGNYQNLALTHLFPAGWEIRNSRLTASDNPDDRTQPNSRDIRDDRIYLYFDLAHGDKVVFRTPVNAGYIGKYYLPAILVEAMYDTRIHARTPGRWIEVTAP